MVGRSLAALVLATCGLVLPSTSAVAKVYEPTRFDDPNPNGCRATDCSLREATVAANRDPDADQIKLDAGRYRLSIPEQSTSGKDGGLMLYFQAAVVGRGPGKTIVDGRGRGTVFESVGTGELHTLRGMTIRRGVGTTGGGIFASGPPLTLSRVVVEGNSAEDGGGIYSRSIDLEIVKSTIAGNSANGHGGGIFSGAGFHGPPATSLRASTVSSNSSSLGGGIALDGSEPDSFPYSPSLEGLNSTVAGNQARVGGGGISAIQDSAVTLDNSTVTYNAADTDNQGGGFGGGLWQSTAAALSLHDSILAENTVGTSGGGPQCGGTITATVVAVQPQGGTVCTFNASTYYLYGAETFLGALADNGGPTQTVKLKAGNGAIGLVGASRCPDRDQRGVVRPEDKCDAGAFESPRATP